MKRIYLASPYTTGDVAVNVKVQLDAYNELLELGYAPFAPCMAHFNHMAHPQSYETWMKIDLEWLSVCDALLRLPGLSPGADREIKYAEEHKIPVFYSFQALNEWARK